MKPENTPRTDADATPKPSFVGISEFWNGIEPDAVPECTSKDAAPYFPQSEAHAQRPEACIQCGLAEYCLTKSIELGELRFGIWGGAVPHERKELAKLSGDERALAITAFVAAIKKNPIRATPGILPGRDLVPIPVIKEKRKRSKQAETVDPPTTTNTQAPKQSDADTDLRAKVRSRPATSVAQNSKPTQKTPRPRPQKPIQFVHDGIIEADEGTDVFYQQAETMLGIDGLYLGETMDTRDWIDVLRAVDLQKEPVSRVARRYYISEGTVRRQIRNMRTALKKCSPEVRNQLLGIDAA